VSTQHSRVSADSVNIEISLGNGDNTTPNLVKSAYDPAAWREANGRIDREHTTQALQQIELANAYPGWNQPDRGRNAYDGVNKYDGVNPYDGTGHGDTPEHSNERSETINYRNGRFATISERDGKVLDFTAQDGVKFERINDPTLEDRQALIAKLGGKDPGPEYQFYRITDGSQKNSAGHNDKVVIAKISHDANNNIKVDTLYPVKQTMEYLANGDMIHTMPGGARTVTREATDGRRFVKIDYPNPETKGRLLIYAPGEKNPRTFEVNEKEKKLEELTKKYYLPS
jgi:hypothetical protein